MDSCSPTLYPSKSHQPPTSAVCSVQQHHLSSAASTMSVETMRHDTQFLKVKGFYFSLLCI